MTVSAFFKAAPRGMLISVAIAFVLLNGLGVWQLYRLQWKESLISDLARTEAMAPIPAEALLSQPKPAWRSVSLPPCAVKPGKLIYMHSELDGAPGYRVLTACPLTAGSLLVDLGFMTTNDLAIPAPFAPVGRLRPFEKAGMVTPVNRPGDNDWYWRSSAEMGKALGANPRADYFIVLDLKASNLNLPGLTQGPVTAPLRNHHFEYALTWFGLAWVMLGMFIAFVMQRRAGAQA